ncbi:MAG: SusF/SusE family outer membrane protein [Bacteroidales bacterium]|nr:SusF/SusE family outer membrane protein [Bacteroidales bacterium]MDD3890724.1 SusF/SusE family outer membrane protein [Bacteroidales bacterium]
MKNNPFKSLLKLSWLMLAAFLMFASCSKDDPVPDPILLEDGFYVFGDATAITDYDFKGLMKTTKNEIDGSDRNSLYELYIAVSKTGGFNIGKVTGGNPTVYGPGEDFAEILEADKIGDEPRGWFARGSASQTSTKFTVPESGLYHVVYDSELSVVVVAKVEWGIIGAATPDGWGTSTPLTSSAFNLNSMSFEINDLILNAGDFKFRYSNGWKIVLEEEVVLVNTNFGGAVDALVPGGDNIPNETPGYYTIKINWSLDNGTTAALTKTDDYTPPAYPEAMYIVGSATAYGWDEPGAHENAIMHKIAGGGDNDGVFWKICHLAGGEGFKLAAAGWVDPNLGHGDVSEFDAEGVEVTENDGNMSVAESGMYIVVLDLRNDLKKVSIKAAEVYGIGDAFGSWDEHAESNLFSVDNTAKTLTSPALAANGNIRMYTRHTWIPDWWNAEFNLYEGVIEYRNNSGDEQAAVAGTAGQVITLHFDDNTGSIN